MPQHDLMMLSVRSGVTAPISIEAALRVGVQFGPMEFAEGGRGPVAECDRSLSSASIRESPHDTHYSLQDKVRQENKPVLGAHSQHNGQEQT